MARDSKVVGGRASDSQLSLGTTRAQSSGGCTMPDLRVILSEEQGP